MLKVLFVCVHNSARSQMAEAFFNQYATGIDGSESAGIKPGLLNPFVVRAMAEKGIDISNNITKGVFDLYKEGRTLSHVIAVCDEEIMEQDRIVRDTIEVKVKEFINNPKAEKK